MSICLTACVTEKTRDTIISKLESNDIIQNDWEYLDYDVQDASPIPDIYRYNYYYEDSDDIIYQVAIEGSVSKNDEHDLYYPVTVYNNLEAYETEETYTDSKTDTTKTRTVTKYKETGLPVPHPLVSVLFPDLFLFDAFQFLRYVNQNYQVQANCLRLDAL